MWEEIPLNQLIEMQIYNTRASHLLCTINCSAVCNGTPGRGLHFQFEECEPIVSSCITSKFDIRMLHKVTSRIKAPGEVFLGCSRYNACPSQVAPTETQIWREALSRLSGNMSWKSSAWTVSPQTVYYWDPVPKKWQTMKLMFSSLFDSHAGLVFLEKVVDMNKYSVERKSTWATYGSWAHWIHESNYVQHILLYMFSLLCSLCSVWILQFGIRTDRAASEHY